ncbi:MAG: cytochrome c oxidase subunit II [Acidobacteria bacterium]|nr:cytochrome c oxidase subunit II [Acidobacteriota bacterium]
MIVLLHWLMAVLFVGWGAFFIYTLIRFRAKANPKADYTGVTSHTSSYLEITVAVIEAVLLVGFAIPAWAHRVNDIPPEEEATVVRMIGKQFEWHSHYPGADGRWGRRDLSLITPTNSIGLDRSDPNGADDIVSINQMNLPVNKPVIVYLSSQDVIHSMGIAEMRVKQDAIPGIEIPVWWVPNLEGDFEVNCSQLCGLGHYRMRGFVSIMPEAEYEAWLAEEAALIPAN